MRLNNPYKQQSGFTLIEIMIVLVIVSVIISMGVPALAETVKRNQLQVQANRILSTLTLTRSEAVKRNQAVSVCHSSDGTSCSGDWSDGWIVFTNADSDDTVDSGVDTVIRVYDGLKPNYTLGGTISADTLTYYADGSYAGGAGSIDICSADADTVHSWSVILNTVGRPRAKQGASCS